MVRNSFVVLLETDLKHSFALPHSLTQQHALLLALLLAATINHDHQRDSMLCSLATKAGAMAGRRGALSGPGKVACVDAPWGGGFVGGGGEGRSVHATAYCPRHVDPFPSPSLPCLNFNLCCVDKGPRQGVSRTSTSIHVNREATRAAGGVPLDNPHGDGHGQWRWLWNHAIR